MTESEMIVAIAEMDGPQLVGLVKRGLWWRPNSGGYTNCECEAGRYTMEEAKMREYIHGDFDDVKIREFSTKPYLTSYDAIIPVIQKQSVGIKDKISHGIKWHYGTTVGFLFLLLLTPAQLCEALLRSLGKWKD